MRYRLRFVLVNNNGGGIFNLLPIQTLDPPGFTEFWTTPHGMDFSDAARLYGCLYTRIKALKQLDEAIRESFKAPGVKIIEIATDIQTNSRMQTSLRKKLVRALER